MSVDNQSVPQILLEERLKVSYLRIIPFITVLKLPHNTYICTHVQTSACTLCTCIHTFVCISPDLRMYVRTYVCTYIPICVVVYRVL